MRDRFIILLILLPSLALGRASGDNPVSNAYTFDYNASCAAAYKAYLSLRPDEGDAIIRRELVAHPFNLTATYISDYGDAVTLLFNGDPYQRSQRAAHEDERLERLEKGPDNSPWKRLALSGVHLHWALIRMRQGEQFKAAAGLRRSFLLLKENDAQYPDFAPDDVLYGTVEALAGIIPDSYKWVAGILGMKGSLNGGTARLASYLRHNTAPERPLHEEALLYHAYIRFTYGGEKEAVWQQVSNEALFPIAGNLMRTFFRANLAISYRKADAAIQTLRLCNGKASGEWPVLDFELGSALLLKGDAGASEYLDQYLSRNKGGLYTKDALQMAALAAYLSGDRGRAEIYRNRIRREGNLITDADRQAQRFGKTSDWPAPLLLTARLLIDGGYPQQALQKLQTTNASAFPSVTDKLEYDFRLGRALEETGNAGTAVQTYQRVVNAGRDRSEYFAARSALQMAGIYEARHQKLEARRYYELTLSMRDHDYQASIDQQAKAGLARLKG